MPTQEQLQEIQVIAQRKYPGRNWSQLSPDERKAVLSDFETTREVGASMFSTPMPKGKTVGPSNIYVENPWDAVGVAAQRLAGGYLMGKANRQEETGRGALADLQTRRDSLDAHAESLRAAEEERKRQSYLQQLIGR